MKDLTIPQCKTMLRLLDAHQRELQARLNGLTERFDMNYLIENKLFIGLTVEIEEASSMTTMLMTEEMRLITERKLAKLPSGKVYGQAYKGHWITPQEYGGYIFWPGGPDDYDYNGERGNDTQASSIEKAKELIDQLIYEKE